MVQLASSKFIYSLAPPPGNYYTHYITMLHRLNITITICTHVLKKVCHPGSRDVADIVSVTMPLLSIKDLAVAISTRVGPAENDPPLYKLGLKPVQTVCKGVELLIELFWEVRERHPCIPQSCQLICASSS